MTNLQTLFQIVRMHAGTGNTTQLINIAKSNPRCNILFLTKNMAEQHKAEYIEWFIDVHKRNPKVSEIPFFASIGEPIILVSPYKNTAPLLVDNSCLDVRTLDEHDNVVLVAQEKALTRFYEERLSRMREYRDTLNKRISAMIKIIDDSNWILFRGVLKRKINRL